MRRSKGSRPQQLALGALMHRERGMFVLQRMKKLSFWNTEIRLLHLWVQHKHVISPQLIRKQYEQDDTEYVKTTILYS